MLTTQEWQMVLLQNGFHQGSNDHKCILLLHMGQKEYLNSAVVSSNCVFIKKTVGE